MANRIESKELIIGNNIATSARLGGIWAIILAQTAQIKMYLCTVLVRGTTSSTRVMGQNMVLTRTYAGKELDIYSLRYATYILPLVRPFIGQNKTTEKGQM